MMQRTRWEILQILKKEGKISLAQLAKKLGLVPITVRTHLSVLERQGLVSAEEVRGKVGRPHFVYFVTDKADTLFPQSYDTLAIELLDSLEALEGPERIRFLVEHIAEQVASQYIERMKGKDLEQRIAEIVNILSERGVMAEWEKGDGTYIIREFNCPIPSVARWHAEVCDLDLFLIRRLTGEQVARDHGFAEPRAHCQFVVRPVSALSGDNQRTPAGVASGNS